MFLSLTALVVLFIKIKLTLLLFYSTLNKKLYFTVIIYKKFNVISGYLRKRSKGGAYLHLNNKAYIIDFKNKKISLSDFNVKGVFTLDEFSGVLLCDSSNLNELFAAYALNGVLINYFKISDKHSDKFNINLNAINNFNDNIACSLLLSVKFNIISILLRFIANIVNKGIKYAKKQI